MFKSLPPSWCNPEVWQRNLAPAAVLELGSVAVMTDQDQPKSIGQPAHESPFTRDTTAEAFARQAQWLEEHAEAGERYDELIRTAGENFRREQNGDQIAADAARAAHRVVSDGYTDQQAA